MGSFFSVVSRVKGTFIFSSVSFFFLCLTIVFVFASNCFSCFLFFVQFALICFASFCFVFPFLVRSQEVDSKEGRYCAN